MEDELVSVKLQTRAGQTASFTASVAERTRDGYRFFSYPERRGFKKLIVIKDEAIATISVEAPEQFFESFRDLPEPQPIIPGATPTPESYVSSLKIVRDEARSPQARPVSSEVGPASAVKIGNKEVVVGAAMIGTPKI